MRQFSVFAGALLMGASLAATAAEIRLGLPEAGAADLVPAVLSTAKSAGIERNLTRELVQFAWAIEEDVEVDFSPKPFLAESREFWTRVDAKQLASGVEIVTTAPGAVVRISPERAGKAGAISLDGLEVRIDGRRFSGRQALQDLATPDQLKHAGMPFPEGTAAFRLSREVGAGRITLALPKATGGALLHVFEPDSSHLMRMSAGRDVVASGGELTITGEFRAEGVAKSPRLVQGIVTAPNGASWPMDFALDGKGGFAGRITLDALAGAGEGLWEAHVFAAAPSKHGDVLRDARTAFAVSHPTARLTGEALQVKRGDGALGLDIGIEAAVAARYELRGVVVATAKDGSKVPVAVSHAAAWLEPGRHTIELSVDADILKRSGLGAPYEIRDLRLIRQGDANLQEQRNRGFVIESL
jgi:hypothetical protein